MRTFFGYLTILILVPVFIVLLFVINEEAAHVQSFHEVLDEKLVINPIELSETSFILDANEHVVTELHTDVNRINLTFDEIPDFLIDLFITVEDKHFYEHLGFDLPAMGRALAVNVQNNEVDQGASTITQQLARNQYLTHEKTYNRKLTELLYAYALERTFSKNELLELYINAIYYQNGAYGIEAAARYYFEQPAAHLSKAQLTFLAAIPNNPTLYNPLKNFSETKKRQERMIEQMVHADLLSKEAAADIVSEEITLSVKKRPDFYPDYTTYVEAEIKELLIEERELAELLQVATEKEGNLIHNQLDTAVKELLQSGVNIHTALDPAMQEKSVAAVRKHLPYKEVEGAAAVIDHRKQEIVALVGGKQYKKHDFNRSYQAFRQPGSTIKPLIAYAPYFDRTNASIYDLINTDPYCIGSYCPKNYGGGQYGDVSLEIAFIHSFNIPAVRLLQTVGMEEAFSDLDSFRFSHVSNNDHYYPAAIGGFTHGMSPLELTDAFSVFSNEGFYEPARAIRKITNRAGETLYEWKDKRTAVWSPQTIETMRHLLSRTVQSGTARKAALYKPYVGGKTGTSNDYKDLWFVGLTNELTAGVWVGKDRPENIYDINKISPQLLIWRDIVK